MIFSLGIVPLCDRGHHFRDAFAIDTPTFCYMVRRSLEDSNSTACMYEREYNMTCERYI